jgi:hypothetical protein
MSGRVLLLVSGAAVPVDAAIPDACSLVRWGVADDVVRALASIEDGIVAVVLASDGLRAEDLPPVIEAARRCPVPVVEVRGAQWDGFERLELATVCKGVVSGFGVEAVPAVAAVLAAQAAG